MRLLCSRPLCICVRWKMISVLLWTLYLYVGNVQRVETVKIFKNLIVPEQKAYTRYQPTSKKMILLFFFVFLTDFKKNESLSRDWFNQFWCGFAEKYFYFLVHSCRSMTLPHLKHFLRELLHSTPSLLFPSTSNHLIQMNYNPFDFRQSIN